MILLKSRRGVLWARPTKKKMATPGEGGPANTRANTETSDQSKRSEVVSDCRVSYSSCSSSESCRKHSSVEAQEVCGGKREDYCVAGTVAQATTGMRRTPINGKSQDLPVSYKSRLSIVCVHSAGVCSRVRYRARRSLRGEDKLCQK